MELLAGGQVWSTEQKASPVRQCKLEAAETPTSACYSRDGACLALGTNSGAILILDTSRLAILAVLRDAHVKKVRPWRSLTILAGLRDAHGKQVGRWPSRPSSEPPLSGR